MHLADFDNLGQEALRFRNREMLRAAAGLCLIVHRSLMDAGSKDLAWQAITTGVPTYLIADEEGKPRRLRAGEV